MNTANRDYASQIEPKRDEPGIDTSPNAPTSGRDSTVHTDAVVEKTLSQSPEPTQRSPRVESKQAHSVLGKTVTFKGDLHAEEDLFVQGRIEGSIQHDANCLTIGVHGTVKANIVGRRIIVQGRVNGNVHATESVVIEPSAHVRGDIFAPSVGLKEGAKFKGRIDMDSDPVKIAEDSRSAAANRKAPTPEAAAAPSENESEDEDGTSKSSTTTESKSTTSSAKKRSTRKNRDKK